MTYEYFLLLLPLSTILAAAQRAPHNGLSTTNSGKSGVEVPWHDWGPSGARFLQLKRSVRAADVSGSRAAVLCSREHPQGADIIDVDVYVFELHPNVNLDPAAHNASAASSGWDDVAHSMFIESPGPRSPDGNDSFLKEVVHTSFPMKITHRKVRVGNGSCCGVILTEDALALMVCAILF